MTHLRSNQESLVVFRFEIGVQPEKDGKVYIFTDMARKHKDFNQLAKSIIDIATGNEEKPKVEDTKNPAAVQLGRLGDLNDGLTSPKSLTPERRTEISKNAAAKR